MVKQTTSIAVGARVLFEHPLSNGGTIRFSARVVKIDSNRAWVEMPERVRRIPFPPLGGKRYGLYDIAKLVVKK